MKTGIAEWLSQGWRQFRATSSVSMLSVLPFVILGLALEYWFVKTDRWLIYFVLAWGFVLLNPFLLSAFYRAVWTGTDRSGISVGGFFRDLASSPLAAWAVGMVNGAIYLVWITDALIIYSVYFSLDPLPGLFSNPEIRADAIDFLLYASLLGGVLSLISFPVTVLSLPHILQSGAGFVDAVVFSVKRVFANLPLMLSWALVIGVVVLLTLMLFLPAALVLFPVLAHANAACYKEMAAGRQAQ